MITNTITEAQERILPGLELLSSTNGWQERSDVLSQFVRQRYRRPANPIQILEAGCGRSWPLELGEVRFELTGVDLDGKALAARQTEMRDLHHAVVGDLLTIEFPLEQFDVIYCCEVLEHIEQAEEVMRRFVTWLRPDGVALLAFPDPNTVFGLATRLSPPLDARRLPPIRYSALLRLGVLVTAHIVRITTSLSRDAACTIFVRGRGSGLRWSEAARPPTNAGRDGSAVSTRLPPYRGAIVRSHHCIRLHGPHLCGRKRR